MRAISLSVASVCLALAGCGGSSSSTSTDGGNTQAVSIPFTASVGTETFECGRTYNSVGVTAADAIGHDARLYVHNVRFVTNDGREVPVIINGDAAGAPTANQKPGQGDEGLVLIDLRDKSAGCTGGDDGETLNPDYYDTLSGVADIRNESVRGLRFTVGVPARYNHIDAQGGQPQTDSETGEDIPDTVAVGPLIASGMGAGGMHWSWAAGYVHARLEVQVPVATYDTFFIHLGSTDCDGEAIHAERECENGNQVHVEIEEFDPSLHAVNVDLLSLLSGNDITVNAGGPAGCMSGLTDPDCAPLFERLGLAFPGADPEAEHAPVFSAHEIR